MGDITGVMSVCLNIFNTLLLVAAMTGVFDWITKLQAKYQ